MENSFRCVRQMIFCLLLLAISGHGTAGQTNSTSPSLVSSSDVTGAEDSRRNPSGTPFSDETAAAESVGGPGTVPVQDAPTDETPVENTLSEYTGTGESGAAENSVTGEAGVPFEDAPASETPMENTPIEDTPTDEMQTEDLPTEDTLVVVTPMENATTGNTLIDDTPAGNTPIEDTPAEDIPIEDTLVDDTPTRYTPAQEIPTAGVLTDDTPTDEAPIEDTPIEDHPTEGFPVENNTLPGDTVADTTPSEDTLGEEGSPFDGIPMEAWPTDDDVPKTNETGPSANLTLWSDLGFVPSAFNETTDWDMDQVNGTMDFVPFAFNETTDADMDQVNGTMDFVPFAFNETTDADMDQVNGTMDFVPFAFNETTDADMDQVNGSMVNATGVSTDGVLNVTTANDTDTIRFVDDNDGDLWDYDYDEALWDDDDDEWYKASDNHTTAVPSSYDNFTDNGISPAANVTAAETNTTIESNTTSEEVHNTTKLLDDYDDYDYYEYDEDYDDDEEDEKESPDVTSANETDSSVADDDSVTETSDDSDADVIPSNETSTDNATYTYEPIYSNDTTESTAQAPEKADFVVYDSNGRPCLLASLNITLHFKYHVQVGLVRETYETISKKNTQDGSSYRGSCEENTSTLSITWNNDTFTLNLTFLMQNENKDSSKEIDMNVLPPGANSSSQSWLLQQVSLSYNTANEKIFPGASPALERVSADDLRLFRTPQGMAYMCKTPEVVTLEFKEVDLSFNYVHFMPFGVQSQYFSNDTVQCSGDLSNLPMKEESYTIPLIVAAVLAGIVITILVVYATVRCVARRVRQADYKQME